MANLFCCFLSMGLVFVPKILFIRKHAHDPREREEDKKEEERRYKEIVKENELMQKKVQEVSEERKRERMEVLIGPQGQRPSSSNVQHCTAMPLPPTCFWHSPFAANLLPLSLSFSHVNLALR